jgi:RNA polymerase-binding protein DksA
LWIFSGRSEIWPLFRANDVDGFKFRGKREQGIAVAKAAPKKASVNSKPAGRGKAAGARKTRPIAERGTKSSRKPVTKARPASRLVTKGLANKAKPAPQKSAISRVNRTHSTPVMGKTAAPAPPRPTEAVPMPGHSNDKPRKNQAGLNTRELEHFRELLLAKRREIVGDMSSMEREALRTSGGSNLSTLPIHMADMGTDNYEQEFTLGLVETERKLLREINHALAKIPSGTYGICEGTGRPINKTRLDQVPWARFSIEHAKEMERGRRIG